MSGPLDVITGALKAGERNNRIEKAGVNGGFY